MIQIQPLMFILLCMLAGVGVAVITLATYLLSTNSFVIGG